MRVFKSSRILDRPYDCLSVHTVPMSMCMDKRSCYTCHKGVRENILYLSLNNPSTIPAYATNPSSNRDTVDQRRRYVRRGADWRQEVTFSFESYEKVKLTPSSTSDLEVLMRIPKITRQCISSWIVGRSKIRINTVSTTTSNANIFVICLLSGWHAREGGTSRTHDFEKNPLHT